MNWVSAIFYFYFSRVRASGFLPEGAFGCFAQRSEQAAV